MSILMFLSLSLLICRFKVRLHGERLDEVNLWIDH